MSTRNHHVTPGELGLLSSLSSGEDADPSPVLIPTTLANLRQTIINLPRFLHRQHTVQITDTTSQMLNSSLEIRNFSGGMLVINLASSVPPGVRHTIRSLSMNRCTTVISINSLRIATNLDDNDIPYGSIDQCSRIITFNVDLGNDANFSNQSTALRIRETNINLGSINIAGNRIGTIIDVDRNSSVIIDSISGANAITGLRVSNSIAYINHSGGLSAIQGCDTPVDVTNSGIVVTRPGIII